MCGFESWEYKPKILSLLIDLYVIERLCVELYVIIFYYYSYWGETESTWLSGHYWPIVAAPDNGLWWLWSNQWNEGWQGKPKYSGKTCPAPLCPP
jgi:hypothetical protein